MGKAKCDSNSCQKKARWCDHHAEGDGAAWGPWRKGHVPKRDDAGEGELWENAVYSVVKRFIGTGAFGPCWWLSIKRLDRRVIRDWRDFQSQSSDKELLQKATDIENALKDLSVAARNTYTEKGKGHAEKT